MDPKTVETTAPGEEHFKEHVIGAVQAASVINLLREAGGTPNDAYLLLIYGMVIMASEEGEEYWENLFDDLKLARENLPKIMSYIREHKCTCGKCGGKTVH